MLRRQRLCWVTLFLILGLLTASMSHAVQTGDQIGYWRKSYGQVSLDDPCAQKAHTVFNRVVQAAGTRPERTPSLLITQGEPGRGPVAMALPSGWIVLSKGVLERLLPSCSQESIQGEARLAFVLGHELAHHLQEDFWHLRLFTASEDIEAFVVRHEAEGDRRSQELRADAHSIIYAAMAGFDAHAVVEDQSAASFFREWVQARSDTHPSPQLRAMTVRARLLDVVAKTDFFHVGLQFYQAGRYLNAIDAFDAFQKVFASREAYHNLAVSHHQLALELYGLWKRQSPIIPFHLSLAIEPETRARRIRLMRRQSRGSEGIAAQTRRHLHDAIAFYRAAITRDPAYLPAAANLGAALIIRGILYENAADLHTAVATLLEASSNTRSPALLSNLGVAYWYLGSAPKALGLWQEAYRRDSNYAPVIFNLAEQAYQTNNLAEARRYWTRYVKLKPLSPQTVEIAKRVPEFASLPQSEPRASGHTEHIRGTRIGYSKSSQLSGLGIPKQRQLSLRDELFTLSQYPQHVQALTQQKQIHMIWVQRGFTGISARGVAIGDAIDAIQTRYGAPSRVLEMGEGRSWCYDTLGIAFELREGKVISWLLYDG